MKQITTQYEKGEEVYIISLNTLAVIESCVVVGSEEYYKVEGSDNVLFSVSDLYLPKKIMSKVDLVEELLNIQSLDMEDNITVKMKIRALLEYIDDREVLEAFYKKVI